jgi:hypothetical protein
MVPAVAKIPWIQALKYPKSAVLGAKIVTGFTSSEGGLTFSLSLTVLMLGLAKTTKASDISKG